MPRYPAVFSEFFYDPLTDDVEEFLTLFQQADTVRFQDFSALWRRMRLSDLFLGLPSVSEMKGFCRVSMATAVKYFLPPYSYQVRVGGLYLMYGFYFAQPSGPPVNIRFALKDRDPVEKFLRDSVEAGHYDVVYVYRRLLAAGAFHFTAMPHFLNFQKQRKPKQEALSSELVGRTAAAQELLSTDLLEELGNIHRCYQQLKGASKVEGQAAMIHPDLTSQLKECLGEFTSWQEKTFCKRRENEEQMPNASSVKERYFSSFQKQTRSRRHREPERTVLSSSGPELLEPLRRKRPQSLRSRTWKKLGVTVEESELQEWLLSAPNRKDVLKRRNQESQSQDSSLLT